MNIKPADDRLIVKPIREENKFGILVAQTGEEQVDKAEIVAVGEGKMTPEGKIIPLRYSVGDKVTLDNLYGAKKFKEDGQEYMYIKSEDILGIIQ